MPFQCRFWFLVCKMNVIIWPFWPFPTPKANKSNLALMLLKISLELTPLLLDLIHGELKSHSKILHPAFDFKWVKISIFLWFNIRRSEFLSQSSINLRSSAFSDQKKLGIDWHRYPIFEFSNYKKQMTAEFFENSTIILLIWFRQKKSTKYLHATFS